MSWDEVKKINSNLEVPLDKWIDELLRHNACQVLANDYKTYGTGGYAYNAYELRKALVNYPPSSADIKLKELVRSEIGDDMYLTNIANVCTFLHSAIAENMKDANTMSAWLQNRDAMFNVFSNAGKYRDTSQLEHLNRIMDFYKLFTADGTFKVSKSSRAPGATLEAYNIWLTYANGGTASIGNYWGGSIVAYEAPGSDPVTLIAASTTNPSDGQSVSPNKFYYKVVATATTSTPIYAAIQIQGYEFGELNALGGN